VYIQQKAESLPLNETSGQSINIDVSTTQRYINIYQSQDVITPNHYGVIDWKYNDNNNNNNNFQWDLRDQVQHKKLLGHDRK